MDGAIGPDTVKALLRLLPPALAEQVLGSLDPKDAQRLRTQLTESPAAGESSQALSMFFNAVRTANRPTSTANSPAPKEPKRPLPAEAEDPAADPLQTLQKMDAGLLTRALADEQPGTIATLIGKLDPRLASDVLKRLPSSRRLEVAVRLNQPVFPN